MTNELEQALIGDSAAAPPERILQGLTAVELHREVPGAPHTIFAEVWHMAFWQQITLDWIAGVETPYPPQASDGFPQGAGGAGEAEWRELRERFLAGAERAAAAARDESGLEKAVRCPSRPGQPVRTMSVRGQLESLAAHNAYHLGRVVLLRQILGAWPPAGGGFTW